MPKTLKKWAGRKEPLVHNRIKELREALGMSSEELAFKCGMVNSTINGLELNQFGVHLNNYAIIAKVLGVSLEELLIFPDLEDFSMETLKANRVGKKSRTRAI